MDFNARNLHVVAGGLAAGLIFFISLSSPAAGLIFFFLPLLPLFLIAFRHGLRAMAFAAVIANLATLIPGIGGGLMFLLTQTLPALLLAQRLLLWRDDDGKVEWYPAGLAITRVSAYAGGLFLLVALHYSTQSGGLEAIVATHMQKNLAQMPPEYAASLQPFAARLPSLIFAMSSWVLALVVYANAWFAHFILKERTPHPRASVGIRRFALPWWWLAVFILSAIASFQPSAEYAFIGRTLLIMLMLPYALSGLAWIHAFSQPWPGRAWLLAIIYLLLFAALWPVAILAGIGLWEQFRGLQRQKPLP